MFGCQAAGWHGRGRPRCGLKVNGNAEQAAGCLLAVIGNSFGQEI